MDTTSPIEQRNFPLDAAAANATLDSVCDPIVLMRDDGALIYGNASAHDLDAWLKLSEPPRRLETELATFISAAKSDRPDPVISLSRSSSEARSYRVNSKLVSKAGATGAGVVALVLSLVQNDAQEGDLSSRAEVATARARLEEARRQLLQADRMSSIGQLAAGVAHEINNPIGYIQSNLGTLTEYVSGLFRLLGAQESALRHLATGRTDELAQVEEIRRHIDFEFLARDLPSLLTESQEGIERVRRIIRDLREFSRAGHAEAWSIADIHAGLDSTINIVWNDLKYKVDLVKSYGEIPLIKCLPSQLNQVFMNVLVNAGHAIVGRGQITVATRADAERVYVEISDTGKGIAAEDLQHIFEPFFTTKPVGQGTGLGLSISCGIVKKHGGRVDVRSQVGQGTTVVIALPIQQRRPENVAAATPRHKTKRAADRQSNGARIQEGGNVSRHAG